MTIKQNLTGIRREDKNPWERRAPLTPGNIKEIAQRGGVRFRIQPSKTRIFTDREFEAAGAEVEEDLSPCKVVFGVKEIPADKLIPDRVYAFFSHVIKGQPQNMPMLKRLLELGCTLIDYERIVDEKDRRLIFFGRYAGVAGMIDTLWALGQRLDAEGFKSSFSSFKRAIEHSDLETARKVIIATGLRIRSEGIPEPLRPLVVGFAGYGNVSRGAQEILDLLPVKEIRPEELQTLSQGDPAGADTIFKVVFEERHMVVPAKPQGVFDLQDYYRNPSRYSPSFEPHLPHLTVLMNCIYWEEKYPRLVTKAYLKHAFAQSKRSRLRVIGDISCDIEGAVECTLKCTTPQKPVFVYLPAEDRVIDDISGQGVVVLAVDNLPAELPADASRAFGRMLQPFIQDILAADYTRGFDGLALAPEVKRAVIAHRGSLTPEYQYIEEHLSRSQAGANFR